MKNPDPSASPSFTRPASSRTERICSLLLIYVLLAAAYFRFTGLYWGEFTYMHPDERFLVWVGSDISPVQSLREYFDTANSSLNPHNRGHGFYVYGTLPMFLARYLVEWIYGHSGFDEMTRVGRALSALADLGTVWLVYLVARRLFEPRTAVLAAAFSAAVVLQIQQAHFFTMDSFLNALMFLAFYFAVLVLTDPRPWQAEADPARPAHSYLLWPSLGFGVAFGMAMATKVNALPMAVALPAAMLIRWLQTPPEIREQRLVKAFGYLALAAVVSVLVFRLFQPYAFSGPGFFGIKPNPLWIANLQDQAAQRGGDVDFPPNMQWARRPVWFSAQNLTLWGLGLPLGLLAWAGFLAAGWMLWRTVKSMLQRSQDIGEQRPDWQPLTLIWLWTAIYFVWQSLQRNPTMRYQLPIYPTLTILAAWALVTLYDRLRSGGRLRNWQRPAAILIGALVLLTTYAYAFAFTQIYVRPFTRAEASRWIYRHIPGPINLLIQTGDEVYQQPLSVPYQQLITPGMPLQTSFQVRRSGELKQILLPHVLDQTGDPVVRTLTLSLTRAGEAQPAAMATLTGVLSAGQSEDGVHPAGRSYLLELQPALQVQSGEQYLLKLELPAGQQASPPASLAGTLSLRIQPLSGDAPLPQAVNPASLVLTPNLPFSVEFSAEQEGQLTTLVLTNLPLDYTQFSSIKVRLQLQDLTAQGESQFTPLQPLPESLPAELYLSLEQPLPIWLGHAYRLTLQLQPAGGAIALRGAAIANEGDWDDGLPLRLEGYDGYGGIYPPDLNLNMYWDDNPEKVERFIRILDQAEYLVISSNRQWGSLPRLPERFPMTTEYYRQLLGCPLEWDIVTCYRVAQPGMFQGELGFELVRVFESPPSLFGLTLNDQFAEEAFTVYDHPKVFIFQKRPDYYQNPTLRQNLAQRLRSVDLSHIVRLPPMRYGPQPANLLLPPARLAQQRQGGTWAELFDPQSALNRSQPLAVLVWYLTITLLGWISYPLLRLAVPGLDDRGYPLARITGLLLLSYLVWLGASLGLTFTRPLITAAASLLLLGGILAAVLQRHDLRQELRQRGRTLLAIEGLALLFFLIFLLIRWGNPDLWHPWKGGEKPMDFSYFNAVLKSSSFPPYDPWYAGGYLNYYYYGFVLVGVPVKWLGINPAVAYNLILPTLASLIGLGAFSVAWNLTRHSSARRAQAPTATQWLAAASASLGMILLGNLGTVRMVFQGFQRLAAPEGNIAHAGLLTRWVWAIRGFFLNLQGASLPYSIGDWYWIPSRAIPAPNDVEPITEFPLFTLLYADLHAHLLALPITLLALALAVAILLGRARWQPRGAGLLWLLFSALAIGALRPTNTWDFPPYLLLGMAAAGYALWNDPPGQVDQQAAGRLRGWLRLAWALGGAATLALLAFWLFQPYSQWYLLGYSKVALWRGTHTPLSAYLTHWGLFLFILVLWLAWETRQWLASTPVSALRRLRLILPWIQSGIVLLLGAIIGLAFLKVSLAWFVLPLAAWCGILLLRPGQPLPKQIVLFLTGAGLLLTLVVEVIVLVGDIGRMNTVFKFYLQVWTLFSVSAAAALGWLSESLPQRASPAWRRLLQVGLSLLVSGATLFTITATMAKISDRMAEQAPHTLDGMAFMPYAVYTDEWGPMALDQDYQAIRWLQENVKGSPVIVEANLRNLYRWGSRMTIYTGLPGVVGWEWHQQQQRAVVPGSWVSNRIAEVDAFYLTTDLQEAANFLRKYQVRYIIVGQQERGHYAGPGLEKFADLNGFLWQEVYRDRDTVIYAVLDLDPMGAQP